MKDTLLINLYGGPGTGKTTGSAYIFSQLKMKGIDCEYVPEYAKDRTWQGDKFPLEKCQLYVTGKQALRVARLYGKVDAIITDSPIILGALYTDEQAYKDICKYEQLKYKNQMNFMLTRTSNYNPNGRNQTEEEAKQLDKQIYDLISNTFDNVITVDALKDGYDQIIDMVLKKLKGVKG